MVIESSITPPQVSLASMTLRDLFALPLRVPPYQREYAWQPSHVADLLNDLLARATRRERASAYLMGTVILHKHTESGALRLDIVDGQQRLVTLTILLNALTGRRDAPTLPLLQGTFSTASAARIKKSQATVNAFLLGKSASKDDLVTYLCSPPAESGALFSVLTLSGDDALDRAYTFFDSVNSKGKRLTDFDLLKAHHLMYIPPAQESLATRHNDGWQAKDGGHEQLFSLVLRRLRMWNRGLDRDARGERPDYGEFCSVVEPDEACNGEHTFNRYMQPAAFRSWRRVNDRVVLSMDYPAPKGEDLLPTEVTQTIEGGDAFFLYAARYHALYTKLYAASEIAVSSEVSFVRELADHMSSSYLQNAFRAVMLLYVDKFGEDRLVEAAVLVERLVSAWRWHAKSVRIEGTLTHVRDKNLVPSLLTAFNARHAVAQLRKACESIAPVTARESQSGAQRRYFDDLARFYRTARSRIPSSSLSVVAHFCTPS